METDSLKEQTLNTLLNKGLERHIRADTEKVNGRLDYVLEKNSHIERDRISVPPELMDLELYIYSNKMEKYLETGMKDAAMAGISVLLWQVGAYFSIESENSLMQKIALASISIPAYYGCKLVFDLGRCAYHYLKNQNEVWFKPLTDRERTLANYVYMKE
jgi:hypothetical protein